MFCFEDAHFTPTAKLLRSLSVDDGTFKKKIQPCKYLLLQLSRGAHNKA